MFSTEKKLDKIKKDLEGMNFEQLAEHFKEWEKSGYYNSTIDNVLMDAMIAADEDKFIAWADQRENGSPEAKMIEVKEIHNGRETSRIAEVFNLKVGYYKFGFGDTEKTFHDVYDMYIIEPTHDDMAKKLYVQYMQGGKIRLANFEIVNELNYLIDLNKLKYIKLDQIKGR